MFDVYVLPFAALSSAAVIAAVLLRHVLRAWSVTSRDARRRLHDAPWPDRAEAMRRHPAGGAR